MVPPEVGNGLRFFVERVRPTASHMVRCVSDPLGTIDVRVCAFFGLTRIPRLGRILGAHPLLCRLRWVHRLLLSDTKRPEHCGPLPPWSLAGDCRCFLLEPLFIGIFHSDLSARGRVIHCKTASVQPSSPSERCPTLSVVTDSTAIS
jgi:hypothetical protein